MSEDARERYAMFAIYARPESHPSGVIVRRVAFEGHRAVIDPAPVFVGATPDEAREFIRRSLPGAMLMMPGGLDHEIFEVWA